MTWQDVTREPKPSVVRQFGALCLVVLGGAGLWQALGRSHPVLGGSLVAAGGLCLVLGWRAPRLFRWVYTGAMVVAFPVGFVVSQVILALLFFGVFLAVGGYLRWRGWDAMLRRRQPPGRSYWEARPGPANARRYLKQY